MRKKGLTIRTMDRVISTPKNAKGRSTKVVKIIRVRATVDGKKRQLSFKLIWFSCPQGKICVQMPHVYFSKKARSASMSFYTLTKF